MEDLLGRFKGGLFRSLKGALFCLPSRGDPAPVLSDSEGKPERGVRFSDYRNKIVSIISTYE
jgi:hypothetical protein